MTNDELKLKLESMDCDGLNDVLVKVDELLSSKGIYCDECQCIHEGEKSPCFRCDNWHYPVCGQKCVR